jgi:small nuclear ribonucleoprotein (snRNP)-like protein
VTIAREPPNVVAIDGVAYKVKFSLMDNLKLFVGKRINVTLASGYSFEGTVKEVGRIFFILKSSMRKILMMLLSELILLLLSIPNSGISRSKLYR